MRDYAYEAALRFANRIRKEDGRKPLKALPRGYPTDPCECPLGRATGRRVWSNNIRLADHDLLVGDFPRDVQRFVAKFDKGGYPELVA